MKKDYLGKQVTCFSKLFTNPITGTIQKEYTNTFLLYVESHHEQDEQKVRECCYRVVVSPEEICAA